ncbi:MAG: hypothetical protein JWR60_1932 [Polaromonas sp.]|nr:hypothetical protein [Polaromonas sp.]
MAGLLALALLLPACSTIKLAYNQAPELAYWYLDGYADFSDAQKPQVRADLKRLQEWHRQTQLPGYIELLQDAQRQVHADASGPQICAMVADARRRLRLVGAWAEPSAALVAASFDASQLQHLERRFAKANAEYREDFLEGAPEARRKQRLKKAVSRAEMLYGRIDDAQEALLGRIIDQSSFDATRAYAERLRRQQDALDTLRQLAADAPADKPARSLKAVNGLIERALSSPDIAYRDYADKLLAEGCKSFAEFHNATSAAQRDKAAAVLSGYEKDFITLVGQGRS